MHVIKIPKDSQKGKRCFIVAAGPSTEGMDLKWLRNEITICVNQSYRLLEGFDPTYICISDEGLWPHMKDIYTAMKTQVVACFADTQKFSEDYPGDNLAVIFKNLDWERDPNVKKYHHFDLPKGLHSSKNVVPSVAIPFAQWAGFDQVYLIGCDCTDKGYGYEGGVRNEKQLFSDFTMQYYKLISELKCNTKIYNATVGGKLEYFPRVDFQSLLNRQLMVIGYYTLNGDYESRAKEMEKSVTQHGVSCTVVRKRGANSSAMDAKMRWALGANFCPFVLQQMRRECPEHDLFYLDVDAKMLKRPDLLLDHPRNYDFGAVFIDNDYWKFHQLCGGGLFFAATKEANELLDRWCEVQSWRNEEIKQGMYRLPCIFPMDQETLQTILLTIPSLRWVEFPPEYGYIAPFVGGDNRKRPVMPVVHEPVIEHYQASRTNRGWKESKCQK